MARRTGLATSISLRSRIAPCGNWVNLGVVAPGAGGAGHRARPSVSWRLAQPLCSTLVLAVTGALSAALRLAGKDLHLAQRVNEREVRPAVPELGDRETDVTGRLAAGVESHLDQAGIGKVALGVVSDGSAGREGLHRRIARRESGAGMRSH